jgi:hypothetical protein
LITALLLATACLEIDDRSPDILGRGGASAGSSGSGSGKGGSGGTDSGGTSAGSTAPAAGAGGAGDEPDVCPLYCERYEMYCPDTFVTDYAGTDECLTVCEEWPLGSPGDAVGDTANCRLTHATNAMGAPSVHCQHAYREPVDSCVD